MNLRPGIEDTSKEFADLCRQPFRIRRPTQNVEGLLFGRCGSGDCLEPIVTTNNFVAYFDPDLEPEDNDLVLFEWEPTYLAQMRSAPGFEATPRYALKIFRRRADGSRWGISNQWGWDLATYAVDARVIGVCRHIVIDGRPALGSYHPTLRRWISRVIVAGCAVYVLFDLFGEYL